MLYKFLVFVASQLQPAFKPPHTKPQILFAPLFVSSQDDKLMCNYHQMNS